LSILSSKAKPRSNNPRVSPFKPRSGIYSRPNHSAIGAKKIGNYLPGLVSGVREAFKK